jgi:tubulin delta
MSNCIFVETGQCGNQLGFSLFDSLYAHLSPGRLSEGFGEDDLDPYFRHSARNSKPLARAVCLDTEPKVINECMQRASQLGKWNIDPKSVVYRHGGAGNNWALGYEMASGEFLNISMDLIRRELEFCDHSKTIVLMHSVAGGTGSGLGTKVTECCEDEFNNATRLNIAVAPYHFGEVAVQHYNAILCLAKISAASHGVLVRTLHVACSICHISI